TKYLTFLYPIPISQNLNTWLLLLGQGGRRERQPRPVGPSPCAEMGQREHRIIWRRPACHHADGRKWRLLVCEHAHSIANHARSVLERHHDVRRCAVEECDQAQADGATTVVCHSKG